MQKFNVGDKVEHVSDPSETGIVFAVASYGYYQINWEKNGKLLHHEDFLVSADNPLSIASCIAFLQARGYIVNEI